NHYAIAGVGRCRLRGGRGRDSTTAVKPNRAHASPTRNCASVPPVFRQVLENWRGTGKQHAPPPSQRETLPLLPRRAAGEHWRAAAGQALEAAVAAGGGCGADRLHGDGPAVCLGTRRRQLL